MNPRHLDIFCDVARHSGFTRAAEALGIGQPFVTRSIARLEAEIGFPLFLRGHGGVTLTPEGELFLQEVERSRAGVEALVRAARQIRDRGTAVLRVACLPALSFEFVPRVMALFAGRVTGVTSTLAVRSPETIWNWVASRQCDLGLARPKSGYAGVDAEPLLSTAAMCALPRGHRLASKKTIAPKDLKNEPIVSAPPSAPHQARVERAFADAGVAMRVAMEAEYTASRCALVAQGVGVAIVDPVAARGIANPRVVLRRFIPDVMIETSMLFPSGRPRSRLTLQLSDLLRAEARSLATRKD
jgi:DNA-binding transcriptional LysR family regulator